MNSSEQHNKEIVKKYIEEVLNRGKFELIKELFGANLHEQVDKIARGLHSSFPDMHETVHDLIAEGNIVMARWTFSGTQEGEFLNTAPTNKKIEITGFSVYYFDNGKIIDDLALLDLLGALKQMGVDTIPIDTNKSSL